MAEEIHTVYLQDKWAKMEARNPKRFVTAAGGFVSVGVNQVGNEAQGSITKEIRRGYVGSAEAGAGETTFHWRERGGVA